MNVAYMKSKTKIDQKELASAVVDFFKSNFPKIDVAVEYSTEVDVALNFKIKEFSFPVWVSGKKAEMFSVGSTSLSRSHTDKILFKYYDKIRAGLKGDIPMSTSMDGYSFLFDAIKAVIAHKYSKGVIDDDGVGKYPASPLSRYQDFSNWLAQHKKEEEAYQAKLQLLKGLFSSQPSLDDVERVQKEIWSDLC